MTITITVAGTTVVTTHLIRPGLRYLPFQFVKRRSLRRRCTHRRSMDGYLFPLRLPQAAADMTTGLETTVQTRAIRHHTWARDGGEYRRGPCPLAVKGRHAVRERGTSASSTSRRMLRRVATSAMGHKADAGAVQRSVGIGRNARACPNSEIQSVEVYCSRSVEQSDRQGDAT